MGNWTVGVRLGRSPSEDCQNRCGRSLERVTGAPTGERQENFYAYRSVACRGTRARPRRVEEASVGSSSTVAEPAGRVDGDPQQYGIDGPRQPHDASIGQLDLQLP